MLELIRTKSFKKALKKYRGKTAVISELEHVVDLLINEQPIPRKYKDHALTGNYSGVRELHLKPDDLLLYIKIEKRSITLVAIGSHSEVF